MSLPDVQARPDERGIALDEVGVKGLRLPVLIADGQGAKRETVATVAAAVNLEAQVKGAHLSRFVEVLSEQLREVAPAQLDLVVEDVRQRLGAQRARVEVCFPYFLERHAPVSGLRSLMDYDCSIVSESDWQRVTTELRVRVPVTSVCPCSKAISDRGAHNQRGYVTITARLAEGQPAERAPWFTELIDIAEASGSSPVYALLKRPDERHVTMAAYDNPVFVEDMARSVASALCHDTRVAGFDIDVVNDESIHNHDAYAHLSWPPHTESAGSGATRATN